MTPDEQWMARCLELAHQAGARGEVPVGALIVAADGVVAEGVESSRGLLDPSAHAEVCAIRNACRARRSSALAGLTLYSTVEPCVLCGCVIRRVGLSRVVYGIPAGALGACTSTYALLTDWTLSGAPPPTVIAGVLHAECAALMRAYPTRGT